MDNYFTILWWFLPCINMNRPQVYMYPPHPEHPTHLPPHPIPLGCPKALVLSALLHALKLHWPSILHMIMYMFQCYSLKSSDLKHFCRPLQSSWGLDIIPVVLFKKKKNGSYQPHEFLSNAWREGNLRHKLKKMFWQRIQVHKLEIAPHETLHLRMRSSLGKGRTFPFLIKDSMSPVE